MSDSPELDAEREREIAECKHDKGYDKVCRGCGMVAPGPPDGWQEGMGEWYDVHV